ncbi:MAG: phosphonate ABC transporter, permease protein PhnE, partial [Desulfohalobiaceae bacterium]|nr:phosphonate ABC transporter, permease protein PhnE [Desulfohalobiaceae bacterium]
DSSSTYPEIWKKFTPVQTLLRYIGFLLVVLIAVWALSDLDITWFYFLDAHEQIADMAVRMWPPDLTFINNLTKPLIETIHIATLGTAGAVIIAFPIAFLAARNTTFNGLTWFIGRLILVTSRSVNTVVWGLLFVAVFGPGPMAGIWAIAFRSIGFVGKLVSEAIEEIDPGVVEAVESTGASKLQVLIVGILPQVLPVIVGTTVYRWDINIRESTVLGFVGAGGIGILLYSSINQFLWREVTLTLFAIFCVVVISEFISAAVRSRIS